MSKDGKFTVKKITKLTDIVKGEQDELPESDLCFQMDNTVVQFDYEEAEEEEKIVIKPGIFTLVDSPSCAMPKKSELIKKPLLDTIDNTSKIINEANLFFNNLDIYDTINRPKKRGVLLYSRPGLGKTAGITSICHHLLKEDPGTVVFNWPTSEVNADDVSGLLSLRSQYDKKCTRMVLIIEDIGGGEREMGSRSAVDSGLLNLLDGMSVSFKLPTFIMATTNYPEHLLEALADRPGRFDLMLELAPPSAEERKQLLEFLSKKPLTNDDRCAIMSGKADGLSIAHLEEVVIRSLLHKKSIAAVIKELIEHTQRFNREFQKPKKLGIG